MYYQKYLPIKQLYKFPYSKQKWNDSPKHAERRVSIKVVQGRYIINDQQFQYKKRRVTEGDEQRQSTELPISKSTIHRNLKYKHFPKEPDYLIKIQSSQIKKSLQKNNNFMILQTNVSQENQFRILHKKSTTHKSPKARFKISHEKDESFPKVLNHISLMKILDKKQLKTKQQSPPKKISININQIGIKHSLYQKIKQEKISQIKNDHTCTKDGKKVKMPVQKLNEKYMKKQETTSNRTFKKQKQSQDSKLSIQQELQKYDLTEDEYNIFGNRFPFGFQKLKLLGRGGFSLVWLGQHKKSKKLFAIKQIITKNNHQTHMKEIWFGSIFFMLGGIPKPQFAKYPGIKNLVKMYSYEINQTDTWIFYERCGNSLGSSLYDIRSQRVGGQKIYKIFFKSLYKIMIRDTRLLKKIIIDLCRALELLIDNNIVHSDVKTENILIKYQDSQIKEVKLIDYGSSFSFSHLNQFSMATPQYMPHEILNYILFENGSPYDEQLLKKVKQYRNPWIIDIWSLGCILLEIINGIPLWMSLPVLIQQFGEYKKKYGLFAVKGRNFQSIIDKQMDVIKNLDNYLLDYNYSGMIVDESLRRILKGMLALEPEERMSPMEVIQVLDQSDRE